MFGFIRYPPDKKDGEFVEYGRGGASNDNLKLQHLACDNCRAKKIRCNGRRPGCLQCKAPPLPCGYSDPPVQNSAMRKPLSVDGAIQEHGTVPAVRDPLVELPEFSTVEGDTALRAVVDSQTSALDHSAFEMDAAWVQDFDLHFQHEMEKLSALENMQQDSETGSSESEAGPIVGRQNNHPRNLAAGARNSQEGVLWDQMSISPFMTSSTGNGASQHELDVSPLQQMADAKKTYLSPKPCACLSLAAILLNELETRGVQNREKCLDSVLSLYKDALFRCEQMIECYQCRAKSENMMLLNMVFEALIDICAFLTDLVTSDQSLETSGRKEDGSRIVYFPERPALIFGDYKITGMEWEAMVRVLVFRKIPEMEGLLDKMKKVTSLSQRESQLLRSEKRLRVLAQTR